MTLSSCINIGHLYLYLSIFLIQYLPYQHKLPQDHSWAQIEGRELSIWESEDQNTPKHPEIFLSTPLQSTSQLDQGVVVCEMY